MSACPVISMMEDSRSLAGSSIGVATAGLGSGVGVVVVVVVVVVFDFDVSLVGVGTLISSLGNWSIRPPGEGVSSQLTIDNIQSDSFCWSIRVSIASPRSPLHSFSVLRAI